MQEIPMAALPSTCAIHEVVIDNIHEKIGDLVVGQKETRCLLVKNHEEVMQNILTVAKLHREDIKLFQATAAAALNKLEEGTDRRFTLVEAVCEEMQKKVQNLNLKFFMISGVGVGIGATLNWVFKVLSPFIP